MTLVDGTSYSVVPQVTFKIPIYHGGTRHLNQKKHQLKINTYETQLKDVEEKIQIEVRKAISEVRVAYSSVKVNELSVAQAAENLRIYRDQFEAGMINGSEVLDAEFLYEEAKVNVINGKADFKIKLAELQKVMGN